MTTEMAAFYRRMLSVGVSDTYQCNIGIALENEEPLSELLLELAFCLSDTNQTISILDNYIGDSTLNEYSIYPMILAEMRALYERGRLSLEQTAVALFGILEGAELQFEGPWTELTYLSYEYDEAKDGYLHMDDFLASFSNYLLS